MGKQGPCCHCGIKSTPLWRNGPPGKPVLCNACGSRWRTKGTLANYTPLHARAFTHLDSEGSQNSQEDKLPSKTKLNNYHIKVYNRGNLEDGELFAGYDLYSTGFEDDTSNRSSSGSAISCSESCILLGSIDGNEISGSVQSGFWDSVIPSRKRSLSRRRSMSPVERLRRDLYEILQEQESSFLSECSEEVLIFQREDPMSSAEIGHGSVLLKPPVSSTEEESVASSLLRENRVSFLNGDHMGSSRLTMQLHSSEISSSQVGKDRLIQDVGDIEELKESTAKESTAKQSSLTNESLGNTLLSNLHVPSHQHSSRICINLNPSNNNSFKPGIEISSCSSHLGGMSLPAKRPLHPPYFKTSGGTSSETIRAFKRPKERMVVQNSSSKTNKSALSPSRNPSILSMNGIQVKPLDKDLQMGAHSDVSCPVDKLILPPPSIQRAYIDEETKPVARTFQYPNPLSLSKNSTSGALYHPK